MAAKKVKERQETVLETLKRKAVGASKTGDYDRSVALLFSALYHDPSDSDSSSNLYAIAQSYFFHDQFEKALAILMPLNVLDLEDFAERDYSTFYAGMALVHVGEKELGETLMRKGIENDLSNPWFTNAFGFYLLSENRLEEGVEFLRENAETMKNSGFLDEQVIETIAWAEYKLHHKKEAVEYILDNSWYLTPTSLLKLLGRFLRLADDQTVDEMLQRVINKIREENDMQEIKYQLSITLPLVGREYARRSLSASEQESSGGIKAIRDIDLESLEGKLMLVKAQLELGEPNSALELMQNAAIIAPEDARVYARLAQVWLAQNDYEEALRAANIGLSFFQNTEQQKGVATHPNATTDPFAPPEMNDLAAQQDENQLSARAELLLAKADALVNLDRLDDAIETLKEAQRLHPGEIIFYNYASTLLLRMDKPKAAAEQLAAARKQGLKLDPLAQKLNRKIKAALARKD